MRGWMSNEELCRKVCIIRSRTLKRMEEGDASGGETGKEQNEKRERVASLVNWWCTRYHVSLRNYYYTQLLSNQRWRKVHQADASVFNARLISARQFHLVIAINMAATRQMYFQRCFLFRDTLYPVSYFYNI